MTPALTLQHGGGRALRSTALAATAALLLPAPAALGLAAAAHGLPALAAPAAAIAVGALIGWGPVSAWLAAAALGWAATADDEATDPWRRGLNGALAGVAALGLALLLARAAPAAAWAPLVAAVTAAVTALAGAWMAVDPDPPSAWTARDLPDEDRVAAGRARALYADLDAPPALRRPLHRLAAAVLHLGHRRVALRRELHRLREADPLWLDRLRQEHDHLVAQRALALQTLSDARAALAATGALAPADAAATWARVQAVAGERWARQRADRDVEALGSG